MNIRMLYFAAVRDLVGIPEEDLVFDEAVRDVADLVAALQEQRPELRDRLGGVRFAVNEAFAALQDPVASGDVVAVIPPVAGG